MTEQATEDTIIAVFVEILHKHGINPETHSRRRAPTDRYSKGQAKVTFTSPNKDKYYAIRNEANQRGIWFSGYNVLEKLHNGLHIEVFIRLKD